jgi:hypothetical protein
MVNTGLLQSLPICTDFSMQIVSHYTSLHVHKTFSETV